MEACRFSTIAPGPVKTDLFKKRVKPVPKEILDKMIPPEVIAKTIEHISSLPAPAYVENLVIRPLGLN